MEKFNSGDKNSFGSYEKNLEKLKSEIDAGILKTIAFLNSLGYFTNASCEGHIKDHGYPYAWVNISTNIEQHEYDISASGKSIYFNVKDNARKFAFEKEQEKFPDLYTEKSNISEEDEANLYWDKNYKEAIKNHPDYNTFLEIEENIKKETVHIYKKVKELVDEFNQTQDISNHVLFKESWGRINFCSIYVSEKKEFEPEERKSIKEKSDEIVRKFEEFIQIKYNNVDKNS